MTDEATPAPATAPKSMFATATPLALLVVNVYEGIPISPGDALRLRRVELITKEGGIPPDGSTVTDKAEADLCKLMASGEYPSPGDALRLRRAGFITAEGNLSPAGQANVPA
jgi:hypothetical protein